MSEKVHDHSQPLTHRQILVILSGLMTGLLLAALDQTIVSTALKRIVEDFNGLEHYSWVVTAYLLTSTAVTPLYGKISDIYGRRHVFQFAIVVFILGSAMQAPRSRWASSSPSVPSRASVPAASCR